MATRRGIRPVHELVELIRELKQVRSNPLYQYSKLAEQRRLESIPRARRWGAGAARLLGLAVLLSFALMIVFSFGAGFSLSSIVGNLTSLPLIYGCLWLLLPLYLSWLIITIYRTARCALEVLSQLGRSQALHVSSEMAATGIKAGTVLAAALARLCPPLLWCALGGIFVTQVFMWAITVDDSSSGIYIEDWFIYSWLSLGDGLWMLPTALAATLIMVLLALLVGSGIRRRGAEVTFCALLAVSQAALMFAGIAWCVGAEMLSSVSLVTHVELLIPVLALIALCSLLSVVRSRSALASFGIALPIVLVVSSLTLIIVSFIFFEDIGSRELETFWGLGVWAVVNPMISGLSVIDGFDEYVMMEADYHEPWRMPLLLTYQLILIFTLLIATRRAIERRLAKPG